MKLGSTCRVRQPVAGSSDRSFDNRRSGRPRGFGNSRSHRQQGSGDNRGRHQRHDSAGMCAEDPRDEAQNNDEKTSHFAPAFSN